MDDTIDDEYNERADKGEKDNNDDKSNEPLWIYILDIICYTLLLLVSTQNSYRRKMEYGEFTIFGRNRVISF